MIKVKCIIGIIAVLVSSVVFADRVDMVEELSPPEYCYVVVDQYLNGANARAGGYARKISDGAAVIELLEHNYPLPKESMWVMNWNVLNDREKEWMSKNVFDGWDKADEILKSGVELPEQPDMFCLNDYDPSSCGLMPIWLKVVSEERKASCMEERTAKSLEKKVKSEHMRRNDNGEYLKKQYERS